MALMTGIDLDRAFAIPVLHVAEYLDLSAMQLREVPGAFHPPQGHVRLGQHLNPAAATFGRRHIALPLGDLPAHLGNPLAEPFGSDRPFDLFEVLGEQGQHPSPSSRP
jgi:hypothetical protein